MHATPPCSRKRVERFEERRELLSFTKRLQHLRSTRAPCRCRDALAVVLVQEWSASLPRESGGHQASRARARPVQSRIVQARHMRGVLARGDERERPHPQPISRIRSSGVELQLVAVPAELPPLCVGERLVRTLEDGTQVRHGLVEHEGGRGRFRGRSGNRCAVVRGAGPDACWAAVARSGSGRDAG